MQNYSPRKAEPSDQPGIYALMKRSFEKPWPEAALNHALENETVLVAEENEKIIGVISFQIIAGECEVKTIAVVPELRKKGIAKMLCAKMLGLCEALRIQKIFLEVDEYNGPAIKLYESLGFTAYSHRKDYYAPGQHAMLMQLQFMK